MLLPWVRKESLLHRLVWNAFVELEFIGGPQGTQYFRRASELEVSRSLFALIRCGVPTTHPSTAWGTHGRCKSAGDSPGVCVCVCVP